MKTFLLALLMTTVAACAIEPTVTEQRMPGGLSGITNTSADGHPAGPPLPLKLLFSNPQDLADPWGTLHIVMTPVRLIREVDAPKPIDAPLSCPAEASPETDAPTWTPEQVGPWRHA